MIQTLTTDAEHRALEAEELKAFSGLKLIHVKRQVADILSLIGRGGIFDEYTRHDISHIDAMLDMLEWLIPPTTKEIMSPGDWLTCVLSIYFHDLGMLVTLREFDQRYSSGFVEFTNSVLLVGPSGSDIQARIEGLPINERDRFLYQEFVRYTHATRIKNWITGIQEDQLGVAYDTIAQIDALLRHLPSQYRRDLGEVCESHHLNDLDNIQKYRVSQPYGNSDLETVNLQYCAIILRTADLLHITSDRTPSIMFSLISPVDPLSQSEWAKQMAVTRVRPKPGNDQAGRPDAGTLSDTIEVHAFFKEPNGFFGLNSYLQYVAEQLEQSHRWISISIRNTPARHQFPWRLVDKDHIETHNFFRDPLRFSLDQVRILDLLVGHTLYNDATVFIRELVQNSIDAVRFRILQATRLGESEIEAKVSVHWDPVERVLSIHDTGIGMTKEVIERHLFTIGSSFYRTPEFKRDYPDFTPISRFGIGLLSIFMLAESGTILTRPVGSKFGFRLKAFSAHSNYLLQRVDSSNAEWGDNLGTSGTTVSISLRPSASMDGDNIRRITKNWIVLPACNVTLSIGDNEEERIGFTTPREALDSWIRDQNIDANSVIVSEAAQDGVCLACAFQRNEDEQKWEALSPVFPESGDRAWLNPWGLCIEGIRVMSDPPQLAGKPSIALINCSGPNAPKTNVLRSGLETTAATAQMWQTASRIHETLLHSLDT